MSAYRFCRTDDIGLLVAALNRCWAPYFPDEPPITAASFKRSIRDLQVWCSSCMVAFAGSDPIGVLIGAKRPHATLIYKIAVHPDHLRQGHGHHLVTSLGSKLAILGPPRIVAEVPEPLAHASDLLRASGYIQEGVLTDYELPIDQNVEACPERAPQGDASRRGFVIPVSVDDLAANGLLGKDHPETCWARSVATLTARKDEIAGLAVATDEQIEACLLYTQRDEDADVEILSLRSSVDDDGSRLKRLLSQVRSHGTRACLFPKVHATEISKERLETLGFHPVGRHLVYAATAQSA